MVYPHIQYLGPAHPTQAQLQPHPQPQPASVATTRELDSRISDGIQVRLLWHPDDGHVSVAVDDSKTGEIFELPVADGESALEVFRHPFAYSARRVHPADGHALRRRGCVSGIAAD
jgi:hypothetical protein